MLIWWRKTWERNAQKEWENLCSIWRSCLCRNWRTHFILLSKSQQLFKFTPCSMNQSKKIRSLSLRIVWSKRKSGQFYFVLFTSWLWTHRFWSSYQIQMMERSHEGRNQSDREEHVGAHWTTSREEDNWSREANKNVKGDIEWFKARLVVKRLQSES